MARVAAHITETDARDIFSTAISHYSAPDHPRGDLLFRQVTERDYGIDGEVELFDHGEPTGRFAKIQLKGTEKEIYPLKSVDMVSCHGISRSNLSYCRQRNFPVILVYCSIMERKFYYIDLQSVFQERIEAIADNFSGTVRIPVANNSDDLSCFVRIINSYYDKPGGIVRERGEVEKPEDDEDEMVSTYAFELYDRPADGEHKQIGANGVVTAIGYWKNERLVCGTEFNTLIQVTHGRLIRKEDPSDPYDASEDFEYDRLEQYGWYPFEVFLMARNYIIEDGMESYYVVDFDVEENTEQMKNIRTLQEFLEEREPKWLEELLAELAKEEK